jgi:hypothetical protein
MLRIILILLILFLAGFFYSLFAKMFSRLKFIMLLPTILGILFIMYTGITSNPNDSGGLEAIRILIKEFVSSTIITGNISGFLFFILGKKKPRE